MSRCPADRRAAGRRLTLVGLLLAACAGGPPVPDWQIEAHDALSAYTEATLNGRARVAAIEWARAREAVARTGRADLLARVELTGCALDGALLHPTDCPGFTPLAPQAGRAERAYAEYLAGRWETIRADLLPAAAKTMVTSGSPDRALTQLADPLSQLVAAGILLRRGALSPAGITTAIDAATAQGWRAALLVWLELELERERRARLNDPDGVAALSARIEIVTGAR